MTGCFSEGEIDNDGHEQPRLRFLECRCENVERGGCTCEDDGEMWWGIRERLDHADISPQAIRCGSRSLSRERDVALDGPRAAVGSVRR